MFRLSKKSDYGLILLSNLSRTKKLVSISSVAKKNKLSSKFLSQVAGELKRAGIVKSKEGVSGGYTLAKAAGDIKILDVLKTLDGELVISDCLEDDHECNCGGKDMFTLMKKQMEETIGKKTVADLVG
ncbi:MAG TPA: Rrf2 family transcriptional regulator [Candidatus Saccharimonadales bacterium]|nr:Rrf2 family transcriptional regulator [Candidatus Saccharimonadales bacterium]